MRSVWITRHGGPEVLEVREAPDPAPRAGEALSASAPQGSTSLGGRDWRTGYELLRAGGRIVAYGFANAAGGGRRSWLRLAAQGIQIPRFNPLRLMNENRAVAGFNLGHLWKRPDLIRGATDALVALWREGKIKPHVDSTFSLEHAADAHRRLEERKNVGKVVLVP